ncbi:MAG TPA: hypothetical protein VFX96_16110 [Pyrinomonadaceae bacterium]|nr:hypothetical protein [Pyrinomonadaceae bacterium]
MPCPNCCAEGAARKGLRRGLKFLVAGLAVGAVGYVLGTTVLFLTELTRPDDPKRELLTPMRYALLAAYFLCPGFSLYGLARALYALTFERDGRDSGEPRAERAPA